VKIGILKSIEKEKDSLKIVNTPETTVTTNNTEKETTKADKTGITMKTRKTKNTVALMTNHPTKRSLKLIALPAKQANTQVSFNLI